MGKGRCLPRAYAASEGRYAADLQCLRQRLGTIDRFASDVGVAEARQIGGGEAGLVAGGR